MKKLTEAEVQEAQANLQAGQDPDVSASDRIDFMRRIAAVKPSDLETAPQPAPVKRGRPSKQPSARGVVQSA